MIIKLVTILFKYEKLFYKVSVSKWLKRFVFEIRINDTICIFNIQTLKCRLLTS